MACSGPLLILSILYLSALHIQAFIEVDCSKENVGLHGQQSIIECFLKFTEEAQDLKIQKIVWKLKGASTAFLTISEETPKSSPKYRLADPSLIKRNGTIRVSLLIDNTVVADEQDYHCIVLTSRGKNDNPDISLKVKAKYNKPIIHQSSKKMDSISPLICEADGGYPKGELRWFDKDNGEWTKSAKMEEKLMDNGLFHLTSRLSLLPGSILPKYTCIVFDASRNKEDEAFIEMHAQEETAASEGEKGPKSVTNIVAPVVVIGSLIVGLLLLLLFRKRCHRNEQFVPVVYMSEADMEEGEKIGTLAPTTC